MHLGSLVLDTACLHVVIASAHVFDDTLMNVVIKQNINPIEKVERKLSFPGTDRFDDYC